MKNTSKKIYRIEKIAESYSKFVSPGTVSYGSQILYEMEMDLRAMKLALERMGDFLEANAHLETKPRMYQQIRIGFDELLNRVTEYSCPSNLKDQFKTATKCPLKSECRCCPNDPVDSTKNSPAHQTPVTDSAVEDDLPF